MVETLQDNYPNQIVYRTNADYFASYEKLKEAQSNVVASCYQTKKGHIWFRLAETKTVFILSPKGKLQVKWSDLKEKQVLLKIVPSLLVPEQGQKLEITPTSQQAYISYPPPTNFKLYWCDEKTEYVKKSGRFQSEGQRKRALKHSKKIYSTFQYGQDYVFISPQMIIDKIAFHDSKEKNAFLVINRNDRLLFEHIESGYHEVFDVLTKYRELMDETGLSTNEGFPKLQISEIPKPVYRPVPRRIKHEIIQNDSTKNMKIPSLSAYLESDEDNPEIAKIYRLPKRVSKEKIKMLLKVRNLLNSQICDIYKQLHEYDEPLNGECEDCRKWII